MDMDLLKTLQEMENLTSRLECFLKKSVAELRSMEFSEVSGGGMTEDEVELLAIYRLMPLDRKESVLNRCRGWRDGYYHG